MKVEATVGSDGNELRARKKERSRACEAGLRAVFNDFSKTPGEQAVLGLELFGHKVTEDLEDQFDAAERADFADRELSRLLRMLENRKKSLDKMFEAVSMDESLMASANALLLQFDFAEN